MLYVQLFLCTVVLGYILRPCALRWGLVDKPDHRKFHEGSIPLVGGLMIFISYTGILVFHGYIPPYLITVVTAMLLLGLIDDNSGLTARCRMSIQSLIVLVTIVIGNNHLTQLGNLIGFGVLELGHFAIPFTLLSFVGLINAINMLDGLDGLVGGVALGALVWFELSNPLAGLYYSVEGLALICALAGFMLFNASYPGHRKATIYLGEAGSTTLGLMLGLIALKHCAGNTATLTPVSVFWVLALPVVDTLRVMIVRQIRGANPFKADRTHLHHLLIDRGIGAVAPVFWTGFSRFISGFLRFRLPAGWAANQSTRYPGFSRQARSGAGVHCRT